MVLLGQLAQPDAARALELGAAAAASPRLPDCGGGGQAGEPSAGFWHRAVSPELQRYCGLLARGYASLNDAPEQARKAAETALALLPNRPGALLLRARAQVAIGQFPAAYADFVKLGAPGELALPDALHDFALSAAQTAEYAQAAAAYHLLVSRVGLFPSALRRQRVYVEAGVALMQLGSGGLDESVASLKEARQLTPPPGLSAHVLGALVLALDRQGHTAQARGMAAEVKSWSALERALSEPAQPATASASRRRAFRAAWPRLPSSELHAMLAVLLETKDPGAAAEHWSAFIEQAAAHKSPWLEHARAKLAVLETGLRRKGR